MNRVYKDGLYDWDLGTLWIRLYYVDFKPFVVLRTAAEGAPDCRAYQIIHARGNAEALTSGVSSDKS